MNLVKDIRIGDNVTITIVYGGNAKEFIMPNTDKSAVEIEWILDEPVREDIYEYIVNA